MPGSGRRGNSNNEQVTNTLTGRKVHKGSKTYSKMLRSMGLDSDFEMNRGHLDVNESEDDEDDCIGVKKKIKLNLVKKK